MKSKIRLNWIKTEQKLKRLGLLVFTTLEFKRILGIESIQTVYSTLSRYRKRGLIVQMSRGLYALANINLPDLYIANMLYRPSYISFETALSYHNIIPETVYTLTSATTRLTKQFNVKAFNRLFVYHKIKRQAYAGYAPMVISGKTALMADAEKAMVDLLYLVARGTRKPLDRVYVDRLDKDKMISYAILFNNSKLLQLIKEL